MKRSLRRPALWIGGIALVIAGYSVYQNQARRPPTPAATSAVPAAAAIPDIYSTGAGTTHFPGVSILPQEPNVTGPFVFRRLDLDQGGDASQETIDVQVIVNARELTVGFSIERAVSVGSTAVNFADCRERLEVDVGSVTLPNQQPPSPYICLETDEGRIALFRAVDLRRVRRATRPGQPSNSFELWLDYEYTTWSRPAESGS